MVYYKLQASSVLAWQLVVGVVALIKITTFDSECNIFEFDSSRADSTPKEIWMIAVSCSLCSRWFKDIFSIRSEDVGDGCWKWREDFHVF